MPGMASNQDPFTGNIQFEEDADEEEKQRVIGAERDREERARKLYEK